MRGFKLLAICSSLAAVPTVGLGRPSDQDSALYANGKCETIFQTGTLHLGMSPETCREIAALDRRLNTAYRRRLAYLNTQAAKAALRGSQRSWIASRDASCHFSEPISIDDETDADCFTAETMKRLEFLENLDPVHRFVRRTLQVSTYKRADADLNGDGHLETLVYATDRCGQDASGCDLYVLSPQGKSYRVVMQGSGPTRLPIRLLPTSTHGWRDIAVTVGGGGIRRSYIARLQFDGRGYPDNPTVPPAIPLTEPSGRLLISR